MTIEGIWRLQGMIKKLYEKSEIRFAVAWIIAYCVLTSIGDNMSASVGVLKIITLPILIVLTVILYLFVKKNGLSEKYALQTTNICFKDVVLYSTDSSLDSKSLAWCYDEHFTIRNVIICLIYALCWFS